MKRTIKKLASAFAIMAAITSVSSAQDVKKADSMEPKKVKEGMHEGNHEENKSDWKELNAFHNVMSQTFHPMEAGNFDPIKKQAAELSARAKALESSSIPPAYKNDAVIQDVKTISAGAENLEKIINNGGSDDDIKVALTELHNNFHKLMGACNKEGEHKAPAKKAPAKAVKK